MKIWIVKGDFNKRACLDAEDGLENSRNLYDFHKKGIVENWPGLKVTFNCGRKRKDAIPLQNVTDFTSHSFLFICDGFAKQKLLEKYDCIQFLPVEPIEKDIAKENNFYLPNVLDFAYVLDEENSALEYGLYNTVSGVKKYVFLPEVKNHPIFYLCVLERNRAFLDVFVTDEFKDYVENCGITGFIFKEVFDFDEPDKEYPLMW